jgi:phytoene synthase
MTVHPDLVAVARAFEPDRYVAATLAPSQQRDALIAVAAFAADLRRITATVTEPMMGEIRLQWWRDAIAGFESGQSTGHPIADALASATRSHRLPSADLQAMTEARAFDLYTDPMPDDAALDGYVSKTEAVPFALALRIQHASAHDAIPLDLADLAGRAYGLTRVLVDLPHTVSRGRQLLPISLLNQHDVAREAMMQGRTTPEFRVAIANLIAGIEETLTAIRQRHGARSGALLPLAVLPAVLRHLKAPERDPLRHPVELAPLARLWRIARARWSGL